MATRIRELSLQATRYREAGFRYQFGRNPVYLPEFTITLLHDKKLPLKEAKFHVPLNFSKFDLHDYLYHAYGLKCKNVRSWVVMMKPTRERPTKGDFNVPGPGWGTWYRPPSKKYMIVEMDEPFKWPEPEKKEVDESEIKPWEKKGKQKPKYDFEAWGKVMTEDDRPTQRREGEMEQERRQKIISRQAEELRSGRAQWKPTWMDLQR